MKLLKKKIDVAQEYNRCISNDAKFRISASDVSAAIVSPFSLFCKYHGDPTKIDPPDPFLQALSIKGSEHEDTVLESDYPEMEEISFDTPEEGFMLLLKAMSKGTKAISNFPMFYLSDGMHGYADVLEKSDNASSVWGKHHYVVREIKSARNIKEQHILQAAFYNMMLGNIQGYVPEYFFITNMDDETVQYPYKKYEKLLKETIIQVRDIQNGQMPPAIHGTGMHPWKNYCNEVAVKNDDISLISGIGPSKRKMFVEAGFKTVQDVASSTANTLKQIKGIGEKTSVKYMNSACAITSGECIRNNTDPIELPERKTEIFLDLEGLVESFDDTISDYLIGALVKTDDGIETYHSFIAEEKREDVMLLSFIDFMKKQTDYTIYHWHHYERTHLRKMMERYNIDAYYLLDPDVMIDLSKTATNAFTFPTYSNSIKDIAKWLGFEWKHSDVGAMSSIELYMAYIEDPEAYKDKMQLVLDYNEDDCVATRVIKDWLVTKQNEPQNGSGNTTLDNIS